MRFFLATRFVFFTDLGDRLQYLFDFAFVGTINHEAILNYILDTQRRSRVQQKGLEHQAQDRIDQQRHQDQGYQRATIAERFSKLFFGQPA